MPPGKKPPPPLRVQPEPSDLLQSVCDQIEDVIESRGLTLGETVYCLEALKLDYQLAAYGVKTKE